MSVSWLVSVIGFVLMLVSTVMALAFWGRATGSRKPRTSDAQDFLHRLEEQWRRTDDSSE
jgi:hypothetical protein